MDPDFVSPFPGRWSLRVGLVSDTHIPEARSELWPQAFDVLRDVDCILHGGDMHELALIDELSALAPTFVSRGNGDDGGGMRPRQPDDPRLRESWLLDLAGVRVGLTHDMPVPEYPPHGTVDDAMLRHFGSTELDVVVFGHSHVEAIEQIGPTLFVNPGSPTYPHNLQTQLGTIGLLELADGVVAASIWQLTDDGVAAFAWPGAPR